MQKNIKKLLEMGRIPPDNELSDELFEEYDKLFSADILVSEQEAAMLSEIFSEDCDGLNWQLLKLVESGCNSCEALLSAAEKCPNPEYSQILKSKAENFRNRSL